MPSEDDLIEASPCPNCRSPLTVAVSDLGHMVECPGCGTQFRARRTGPEAASPPPPPPRPERDDPPSSLRPRWDDREDDDRPRRPSGRGRFDDRDYDDDRYPDDRRRRGTPGSVIALAVMHFVYAGLLLVCGVLNAVVLALGENAFGGMGGADRNKPLAVAIAAFMLVTALTMLFAGIFALQRKGWGVSATAIALAAFTFMLDIVNMVVNLGNMPRQGGPEETTGIVCAVAFEAIFWLGYLVTNGILLAKSSRHFR